jgi:selenocysteine-specific elongation factor
MRPLVLGTAGHIDHGKTALVHALTGIDTDRLPDEKRRGITIDLGFARLALPDGTQLSIVDVPGHEAFVRNMLAGATGIDMVMLVVAADEGPMPQTHEHVAILELLGVRSGVVALTKTDLVEPDWLELVREEVHDLVVASSLAGAPIVDVSARTGAGLDALTTALLEAVGTVRQRAVSDLFRMPIDRVFTVRGIGTVVTGTVGSGVLRRDAHVRVLPAGLNARVRGLQQHGRETDEVGTGARAAIALAGVDRDALSRGDTVLTGDAWTAAGTLTAQLRMLGDAVSAIRPRQRLRIHVGTAEVLGRAALLQGELKPGESAIVQLRLEQPLVARAGDRLVVRSYSPVHTIGGGIVLEPAAPKRKRLPAEVHAALLTLAARFQEHPAAAGLDELPAASVHELIMAALTLAGPHGLDARLLPIATGLPPDAVGAADRTGDRAVLAGTRLVDADLLRATESSILDRIGAFHRAAPMLDGMEREAVRRALLAPPLFDAAAAALLADGRLVATGNALALPDHSPQPAADARAAMTRLAAIYAAARLEPPDLPDLPADLAGRPDLSVLLRFLERDGILLRLSATRLISADAVTETVTELRGQLSSGQPLGIADFKELLKLTRKHLIPLLEHFDRSGVTRRTGETRILVDG